MALEEPQARLLISCSADWVGLWVVTGEAREWFGASTENQLRADTRRLLEPLLVNGLIEAGELDLDRGEFESWSDQGAAALERVFTEWEAHGREPSIGDIAWFQATAEGDRLAAQLDDGRYSR